MVKSVYFKKIIIGLLIIALTIGNWGILGGYVIAKAGEELELQTSETKNKNVIFDIGVTEGEILTHQLIGDINELLVLNAWVSVENTGYLKDISITFEGENGENKNFDIIDIACSDDSIKSATKEVVQLNQIEANKTINLEFSIRRSDNTLQNLENLDKNARVRFIGTYVTEEGKEVKLEKTIIVNVEWKCDNNIVLDSVISRYTDYKLLEESGVILTQKIILSQDKEQGLPYKNIEIETEEIKLGENEAKQIIIKQGNREIEFEKLDNGNIKFKDNIDDNKTNIEYSITYVYSNSEIEEREINIKANAKALIYSSDSEKQAETEMSLMLTETNGKNVSIESKNGASISKGKIYANLNQKESAYDVEHEANFVINLAYNEGIEELKIQDVGAYFIDEENEKTTLQIEDNSYTYYKNTKVKVEDFKKILGEDGKIQILDKEENEIATIDQNTKTEEEEYIIEYNEKLDNLVFKTTKPLTNGSIEIKNIKVLEKQLPFEKEQMKTFKVLQNEFEGAYKIEGIEEESKIEKAFTETELIETKTEATLSIETNKLSSIVTNENIEFKIELNNNKETSDLYENPSFEIELPKEIINVDVKEANILFDNELEILDVSKIERSGKIILNVILKGKQTDFLLDEYINGTTIVINTDIDVDIRTASKIEKAKMKYYNENASMYNNENYGEFETNIEFISPVAMIVGDEINGYNSDGSKVISILQGEKTGKLEIYTDTRIANNNLLVMNNTGNECEDLSIIVRLPFRDNKNILTGENLGTTENTKLYDLVQVDSEKEGIEIYYTENGDADISIDKIENGWSKETTDISNIKAFMVKVNDKMQQTEMLNIKYNFEIPENLEHNAYLYQDIVAYYTNNREIAKVQEIVQADRICLTTGRGPQMEIKQTASVPNGNKVNEGQKIAYTIEVKNTGIDTIKNLAIKDVLPENTIYTVYTRNGFAMGYDEKRPDAQVLLWEIPQLEIGNTIKVEFEVEVNKLPTIEEYYSNMENVFEDNGKYYFNENGELKEITEIPEIFLTNQVFVNADDLAKEIQAENHQNIVQAPEILVNETTSVAEEVFVRENAEIEYTLRVKNNKQEDIKNINISKVLPNGVEYEEIYTLKYDAENEDWDKDKTGNYNENTKLVSINIGDLKPEESVQIKIKLKTGKLENEEYEKNIETTTRITADNINEYFGNPMKNTIAKPRLVTEYFTENRNKYVTDGDIIEYSIKVTNEGVITANNVEISDILPDGLELIKAEYSLGDFKVSTGIDNDRKISATGNLSPNESMILTIKAKAVSKSQNVLVENSPSINSQELGTSYAEPIKHIVEAIQEESSIPMIETERKYQISGSAWYDANKNGMQESNEIKLAGIEVMAIDANNGEIITKVQTDNDGIYTINDLDKGNYLVLYKYDANRYSLSDYKKTDVSETINSDVISVNVEENGEPYVAAISDTIRINNSDFENISMGLKDRDIFDLKLESGINQIVLQTSKETKEYKYDYTKFAKLDIAPDVLKGATALVTYEIRVTNEGNIPGVVNNIIDYIPRGMEFKSDFNPNWYIGQDGNVYTNALSNVIIKPGETKILTLVLVKEMTEENTGINVNTLEIYETHNDYGVIDEDSIENNKSDSEDDYTQTTALITIQLGGGAVYTTLALVVLIVLLIGFYITKKGRIVLKRTPKKKKLYK